MYQDFPIYRDFRYTEIVEAMTYVSLKDTLFYCNSIFILLDSCLLKCTLVYRRRTIWLCLVTRFCDVIILQKFAAKIPILLRTEYEVTYRWCDLMFIARLSDIIFCLLFGHYLLWFSKFYQHKAKSYEC